MVTRIWIGVAALALASASCARSPDTAELGGPIITPIADGIYPAAGEGDRTTITLGDENLWISTSTVALNPGDVVPFHTHPGIGVLIVMEGTATFVAPEGSRHTYTAGQSLTEGGMIHSLMNCGSGPLRIQGTFFIPCDRIGCRDLTVVEAGIPRAEVRVNGSHTPLRS